MDIVELIPAYDHPSYISHRLACYFIFHLLWAGRRPADGPRVRMRVLIAPDKFKGTLTAVEAASATRPGG